MNTTEFPKDRIISVVHNDGTKMNIKYCKRSGVNTFVWKEVGTDRYFHVNAFKRGWE